jgi:hypothetical protein
MAKNKQEKRSFRNYQEEFLILLEDGLRTAGRITKREYDRVSESVRAKLERKYGKERVDAFHARLRNNWEDVVQKFESARRKLETDDSLRKGKEIGVQILESLAAAMKRAAETLESSLSDKVTYHAGQVVDKGVFLCNGCSRIQEVKRRRKLTPCPECGSSEYRQA